MTRSPLAPSDGAEHAVTTGRASTTIVRYAAHAHSIDAPERCTSPAHDVIRFTRSLCLAQAIDVWYRDDGVHCHLEAHWQPPDAISHSEDGRFEVLSNMGNVEPESLEIQITPRDVLIVVHGADCGRGQLFRLIHFPGRVNPARVTVEYRDGLVRVSASARSSPDAGERVC